MLSTKKPYREGVYFARLAERALQRIQPQERGSGWYNARLKLLTAIREMEDMAAAAEAPRQVAAVTGEVAA